jgi:hypothetical protein
MRDAGGEHLWVMYRFLFLTLCARIVCTGWAAVRSKKPDHHGAYFDRAGCELEKVGVSVEIKDGES